MQTTATGAFNRHRTTHVAYESAVFDVGVEADHETDDLPFTVKGWADRTKTASSERLFRWCLLCAGDWCRRP